MRTLAYRVGWRRRGRVAGVLVAAFAGTGATGCHSSFAPDWGEAVTSINTLGSDFESVSLAWPPVSDALQYNIYVALDSSVSPANWQSLPGGRRQLVYENLGEIGGLTPGAHYYAVVAARYPDDGTGPPSPWIDVVVAGGGDSYYHGRPMFPPPAPDARWRISGVDHDAGIGEVLAFAGDIDGDTLPDLVVGAPHENTAGVDAGAVFVMSLTDSEDAQPPSAGKRYDGPALAGARFGAAVAVGNVSHLTANPTQVKDLVVSTPGNAGSRTLVYDGTTNGFSDPEAWFFAPVATGQAMGTSLAIVGDYYNLPLEEIVATAPGGGRVVMQSGVQDPQSTDATNFLWENGGTAPTSVTVIGDADGKDGPDFLVGDPEFTSGAGRVGRVSLLLHGPAGQSPPAANPIGDWAHEGTVADTGFGQIGTVAGGDINGDGYADVVLGYPDFDGPLGGEGRIEVWYRGAGGVGFSDTPEQVLEGPGAEAHWGGTLAVADVNGDGFADLVAGAPDGQDNGAPKGTVNVFYGWQDGLVTDPVWTLTGRNTDSELGTAVELADVDGDSSADLILGEPGRLANNETGYVWIYLGAPRTVAPIEIDVVDVGDRVLEINATYGGTPLHRSSCRVSWGDGGEDDRSCESVDGIQHNYARGGHYTVRVRAEDELGLVSGAASAVTVE